MKIHFLSKSPENITTGNLKPLLSKIIILSLFTMAMLGAMSILYQKIDPSDKYKFINAESTSKVMPYSDGDIGCKIINNINANGIDGGDAVNGFHGIDVQLFKSDTKEIKSTDTSKDYIFMPVKTGERTAL